MILGGSLNRDGISTRRPVEQISRRFRSKCGQHWRVEVLHRLWQAHWRNAQNTVRSVVSLNSRAGTRNKASFRKHLPDWVTPPAAGRVSDLHHQPPAAAVIYTRMHRHASRRSIHVSFTLVPSRSQIATSLKFVYLTGKLGGSEWESNPPATGKLPPAGFEDREDHRAPCASAFSFHPYYAVSLCHRLQASPQNASSATAGC